MSKQDRDIAKSFSLQSFDTSVSPFTPFKPLTGTWTPTINYYEYMLVGSLLHIWFRCAAATPSSSTQGYLILHLPQGYNIASPITSTCHIGDYMAYSGGVSEDGELWIDPSNDYIRMYREDRQLWEDTSAQVIGYCAVPVERTTS